MLSKILSYLFRMAFILIVLAGIFNLVIQIHGGPIGHKTEYGYEAYGGESGLFVQARRISGDERRAPDTIIKYEKWDNDVKSGSGTVSLGGFPSDFTDSILKNLPVDIKSGKARNVDTQINVIRVQEWQIHDYETRTTAYDSLPDGRMAITEEFIGKNQKRVKPDRHDTFPNDLAAKMFFYTDTREGPVMISEDWDQLNHVRIKPKTTTQLVLFIAYDLIQWTCLALFFLVLAKLFYRFYRQDYFNERNNRMLKYAGWLLLIPQLMSIVLYFSLLIHLHPAKIYASTATREVKLVCQYELLSGVEYRMMFLGLGLIVLSYIFKNGLKLKEEQALTI